MLTMIGAKTGSVRLPTRIFVGACACEFVASALLISGDHYLTRLLHAHGVPLSTVLHLSDDAAHRAAWAALCDHWHALAGTVVRYWLEEQLVSLFGIEAAPTTPAGQLALVSAAIGSGTGATSLSLDRSGSQAS
mgnify:CR=1 FL=1